MKEEYTKKSKESELLALIDFNQGRIKSDDECQVEDNITKVRRFLNEFKKEVHNNALKMVEEGLGDKVKRQSFRDTEHLTNTEYIHNSGVIDGHNDFREKVINNIQKLKI